MSSDPARRPRAAFAALAAVALAGCGQPMGVVFEAPPTPLRWPQAPDPARIEYVGQLVTDRDLKPAKSFGKLLGEKMFGEDPALSMLSPYAVCTDGAERVFVSDSNAQLVHVFDLETRRYERWQPGPEDDPLAQPLGVAWVPDGRLLVSDGAAGRIVVLDDEGRRAGTIGADLLVRPVGLAVGAGRIYVADAAAHQVVVFDDQGRLLERLGDRGTAPGRFNYPTNVTLDDRGFLYVADTLNFRVQVFDADLRPVARIGSQGDLPGYFSQPKGLALDSDGNLYVVDAHFEAVQIFDADGQLLLTFGHEGHAVGEFWLPAGIHIDSSDRIWIADSYNRRVQVFRYLAEAQ